jgi:hypothetical protein
VDNIDKFILDLKTRDELISFSCYINSAYFFLYDTDKKTTRFNFPESVSEEIIRIAMKENQTPNYRFVLDLFNKRISEIGLKDLCD